MVIPPVFKDTSLKGVWTQLPINNMDERGYTRELFNVTHLPPGFSGSSVNQILEATSSRGVIRGIHYASTSNTQSKIVRCLEGEIRDIVIDLRMDSPTFGDHEVFELNSIDVSSIFISHGFGHAYQVLSKSATVLYALQTNFNFSEEFSINPLDPDLALPWQDIPAILSPRDANAPGFRVAIGNRKLD
jgi:dTDP-4-dehydrorhamnose 3,5-epimerase